MKNNTFKRVLAGSLALLTVAAYVPANVGGILPDLSIVASAGTAVKPIGDPKHETFYNEEPNTALDAVNRDEDDDDINYVQAGGTLKVDSDTTAFIDGVYEITRDAGKYVYKKVGTGTTDLADGKAYVLRTTAYVAEVAGGLTMLDKKDLNGDDLPEGVYEYTIQSVAKTETVMVTTLKTTIQADAAGAAKFAEQLTVTQNGQEIIYDNAKTGYVVAQGFPVEIVANPGEIHTNDMMKVSSGNAVVKSQTRSDSTITLTIVPDKDTAGGGSLTTIQWNSYAPTLQLINEKGTIKATDVGFEQLISNEVVGTYEFRFGSGSNFKDGEVNAKGEYIADGASYADPVFTQQTVKVNGTSYTFVEAGATTYEVKDAQGNWGTWSKEASDTITTPYKSGEYRAKTPITATVSGGATLSGTFEIVTEFKIVAQNVTSTKNLAFIAKGDNHQEQLIQDKNGVYNVPWQNGDEIVPNIVLKKDAIATTDTLTILKTGEETAQNTASDPSSVANKNKYEAGELAYYLEGSQYDYTVTGTTKASEPGTYTMTITPTSKDKFNDGEEIVITWQIVNTNNYVEAKKTPNGLSSKQTGPYANTNWSSSYNPATEADRDLVAEEAIKNAQHFTIGYRQATKDSITKQIIKSLDFVGNTDLTVVKFNEISYKVAQAASGDVTGVDAGNYAQFAKATPNLAAAKASTVTVDDPSEKAGTYVAWVANALQNDGKTSAMRKDNEVYDPDGSASAVLAAGDLYPVLFQVTKTKVRIVPEVTEITYGDDVKLSEMYTVIDGDTKEKIGVPWQTKPAFALVDKYNATTSFTTNTDTTKELAAGEYTYGIANKVTVLDTANYDVSQLLSEDDIDFTINPRDLSDMDFGAVNVPVPAGEKNVNVTKLILAEAANAIDANPADFAFTYKTVEESSIKYYVRPVGIGETANITDTDGTGYMKINEVSDGITANVLAQGIKVTCNDFTISGGTTSAKATALGQTFTVNLKGSGNFTGTKAVKWIVGDNVLSDKVMSYEAEFDAAKPRVMSKFDINKIDGEIDECGFYYNNNGKMKDVDIDLAQQDAKIILLQADKTGAYQNQYNCKKITFTNKAVTSAASGNGLLTAEIANSSVLKQVYIMPYVKYKNGNFAYGKVEKFNYYDMVLNAEGALEMTKTDLVGDGKPLADGKVLTEGKTYVKVDVTRVDKKGYEVEKYGILYNNSDTWDNHAVPSFDDKHQTVDQALAYAGVDEMELAYQWLNLDNASEKTVKIAQIPEKDLATKIGTNTYIVNTTARNYVAGKETKDYGYGAKTVFARAFIQIKDAAGNSKVYYSHLADVTYGGFTEDTKTGAVNGVEAVANNVQNAKTVLDTNNKNQIQFYAPTGSAYTWDRELANAQYGVYDVDKDGVKISDTVTGHMTRMNASTGNKTFQVWWTDQKKS